MLAGGVGPGVSPLVPASNPTSGLDDSSTALEFGDEGSESGGSHTSDISSAF